MEDIWKMRRKTELLFVGGIFTLIVTACSGPAQEGTQGQAQEQDQEQNQSGGLDESSSLTWSTEKVGEGIKPAFALDEDGVVHIASLVEDEHGHVFYSNNASGSFETVQVSEGYFYGPVDIALDSNGTPFIAYHDHQETSFQPNLGDEVVAYLDGDSWKLITVQHPGHDGWDNSIFVDSDGAWHTAAIDPSQFGSQDGVEYATNAGGEISVTPVGSGPVKYEFGTSIQLKSDGTPGITYYDDVDQQLEYATSNNGSWSVEVVDEDGDAGRFSSLAFDAAGMPHISYYVATSQNTGIVRYSWWDGAKWQVEDVDVLENVKMGHIGARKITALVLDGDGTAHLAYTDQDHIIYARRGDSGWVAQEVAKAGEIPLGQLVELEVDGEGNPHLIWFEATSLSPIVEGNVIYASGS
jgi:hypothetical protein